MFIRVTSVTDNCLRLINTDMLQEVTDTKPMPTLIFTSGAMLFVKESMAHLEAVLRPQ